MEKLNLPIFVIIIISVTFKFSQMSPTSLERTSMPLETKKHVAFDVGNILTKVEGLSVKIDGLVDLGPKWNFEYTFVPYSDKNIERTQGPEIENDGANDDTTPTTVADKNTEIYTTKKKELKMRAAKPEHSSESSGNSSEASDTSSFEKSANSTEKLGKSSEKTANSSETLDKSSEKWVKSSEKLDKSSEKGGKSSGKSGKSSGKSDKSSEKGGKSTEKSGKSSVRSGKHSHKSGKSSKKSGKSSKSGRSHKASGKSKISHVKKQKHKDKTTKPKHDYIYKDVDNSSLILRSPHKVQDDARLRDFTVHVYKQALRIFDELKKKFNDTHSNKKIDELIHNYRNKFAEFVNETQYVSVKTRLGTQKVILNTMESSNFILKKLIDHLMADSVQKTVLRNERHDVAGVLEQQLEKEMDVEYRHVCSKFGICRTGYVYSNFVADIIGELIRADNKKLRMAIDAITESLNEQSFSNYLEDQVEKRVRADIALAEKTNVDQLRAILQIIRSILVNKNKPLPVMGSIDSKVMNRSLAVLDLIDLFDDKIKPNEANKLAWNDLRASCRDWADGSREDTAEIMEALIRHGKESGLDKFDAKTIQVLNDKLKIYYDLSR